MTDDEAITLATLNGLLLTPWYWSAVERTIWYARANPGKEPFDNTRLSPIEEQQVNRTQRAYWNSAAELARDYCEYYKLELT